MATTLDNEGDEIKIKPAITSLSASPAGFEGMVKVYGDFVRWLDEGYFI